MTWINNSSTLGCKVSATFLMHCKKNWDIKHNKYSLKRIDYSGQVTLNTTTLQNNLFQISISKVWPTDGMTEWRTKNSLSGTQKPSAWYALGLKKLMWANLYTIWIWLLRSRGDIWTFYKPFLSRVHTMHLASGFRIVNFLSVILSHFWEWYLK